LQILSQIEPFVYEWTSKHRGSISAEHGIGLMKANKIYYSKSRETVCTLCYQFIIDSSCSFLFDNVKLWNEWMSEVAWNWTGSTNGFDQEFDGPQSHTQPI